MNPPAPNGAAPPAESWTDDRGAEPVRPETTVRLQRFLAIALAVNVAVVAVVATIAVILLVTAS